MTEHKKIWRRFTEGNRKNFNKDNEIQTPRIQTRIFPIRLDTKLNKNLHRDIIIIHIVVPIGEPARRTKKTNSHLSSSGEQDHN